MMHSNRLASETVEIRCPACGIPATIFRKYPDNGLKPLCSNFNCQQPLDPVEHELRAIDARVRTSMQRFAAHRVRAFLEGLVNTGGRAGMRANEREDREAAEYFIRQFRDFFPAPFPETSLRIMHQEDPRGPKFGGVSFSQAQRRQLCLDELLGLRNRLRFAWGAEDANRREWLVFDCRKYARFLTAHPSVDLVAAGKVLIDEPPPNDGLQQALRYFQRNGHIARRCAYGRCSLSQFFFAENPNQRYCSEICSAGARSEAKNLWWAQNGAEWRKQRSHRKSRGRRLKRKDRGGKK